MSAIAPSHAAPRTSVWPARRRLATKIALTLVYLIARHGRKFSREFRQALRQHHTEYRQQAATTSRSALSGRRLIAMIVLAAITAVYLASQLGGSTVGHAIGASVVRTSSAKAASPADKLVAKANALHGQFAPAITKWQAQISHVLASAKVATAYGGTTYNILAEPAQRAIVYDLMAVTSNGNAAYSAHGRMGLLPLTQAQRLGAATEMHLTYTTSGQSWPVTSLKLGMRRANDILTLVWANQAAQIKRGFCTKHDHGRVLAADFIRQWDPSLSVARQQSFIKLYSQWGSTGWPANFCASRKR